MAQDLIRTLLDSKTDIRKTLHKLKDDIALIKTSRTMQVSWILDFADNITLSNKAMNGWVEGMPLTKSNPPAPQPEQMRDGFLQKYNLESTTERKVISLKASNSSYEASISTLVEKLKSSDKSYLLLEEQKISNKRNSNEFSYAADNLFQDNNKRRRAMNVSFGMDSDDDA
mmetsp:Transcript_16411/g.22623  ORF Transcript_16411/g.22623 Transcript_16411/m.22623 type:complete len:171 (+) Transcript_16411:129-641(+)